MIQPECDLSGSWASAVPTVRQAMSELVAEGHLSTAQGQGYVCGAARYAPVDARFFQGLQSFHDEMIQKGLVPSTEVLEVKMVTDRPDAAKFLELGEDKRLIHLCRLRSANDRKLVVVDTWLSYGRFRTLMN